MQDPKIKNNYFTYPDRRPPKIKDKGEIDRVLKTHIDLPFEAVADICGVRIKLMTNSSHVYEYWKLNWFPGSKEDGIDGWIYDIYDVEDLEPCIYYDFKRSRVLIVNCEYYGAAKSAGALGLSTRLLEKRGGYAIHGACVGVPNSPGYDGVIIVAPTGTGKTSQFHELIYNIRDTKVHSDDYVFVFFKPDPIAYATENWFYMRSEIALNHPIFTKFFNDLPLENIVNEKAKCAQYSVESEKIGECYKAVMNGERKCVFNIGADRCYWSYANSRVMFPRDRFPMMIKDALGNLVEVPKGKENLENECRVKYVLLLTRDDTTKPVTLLGIDEAIRVLKEGKFIIRPGSGPPEKWGQYGYEPFYNPYPPEHNLSAEEAFFRKLYSCGVSFYLLNTGTYEGKKQTIHQTHMYIRHIVED
jgi:hypothetical protein